MLCFAGLGTIAFLSQAIQLRSKLPVHRDLFDLCSLEIRRLVAPTLAEVVKAARCFEGPLGVRVEEKRQGPPKLHDLPSLQKFCSSRFGWPAAKTLEVAQELYDG